MKTLILGATGATGRLLAEQSLDRDQQVKVIVRSISRLPEKIIAHKNFEIIEADVLDLDITEMRAIMTDCDSVGICLGHNLTLKGLYGKPRKLVRDVVKLVCEAAKTKQTDNTFKLVLMNTAGYISKELNEKSSFGEQIVLGLIRLLLPPQSDNETAAEYLWKNIGQNHEHVDWVVVRPDSLIDSGTVTDYKAVPSQLRSPIFNSGKTSRINTANFMARLMTEEKLWESWKGKMPVIYNKS